MLLTWNAVVEQIELVVHYGTSCLSYKHFWNAIVNAIFFINSCLGHCHTVLAPANNVDQTAVYGSNYLLTVPCALNACSCFNINYSLVCSVCRLVYYL